MLIGFPGAKAPSPEARSPSDIDVGWGGSASSTFCGSVAADAGKVPRGSLDKFSIGKLDLSHLSNLLKIRRLRIQYPYAVWGLPRRHPVIHHSH